MVVRSCVLAEGISLVSWSLCRALGKRGYSKEHFLRAESCFGVTIASKFVCRC